MHTLPEADLPRMFVVKLPRMLICLCSKALLSAHRPLPNVVKGVLPTQKMLLPSITPPGPSTRKNTLSGSDVVLAWSTVAHPPHGRNSHQPSLKNPPPRGLTYAIAASLVSAVL